MSFKSSKGAKIQFVQCNSKHKATYVSIHAASNIIHNGGEYAKYSDLQFEPAFFSGLQIGQNAKECLETTWNTKEHQGASRNVKGRQ